MVPALNRLESTFYSSDRRVATAARAALLVAGAAVAVLVVAVAGPLYGVAAVIALIGALLMLRDLRWGLMALFAVVGVLPFATLPFKLGFTPTFLDLAVLALYLVWIMRIATRRQRELVGTSLDVPVLVFLLLAVFAFANGLRFGRPTVTTIRNFAELALGIGFFFLLVNNLRDQADLDFVTRLILLAGAAAATIAVIFYFIPQTWTLRVLDALARFGYPGGAGALRYIEDDSANPMRAIGTMIDPNVLGGFLILVAGLVAPQVVSPQPIFRRRWVAVILGVELLALYLTYSRGSLVGLAAGLLLIGLLRYRKLLLIGVFGAALTLLLPPAQAYVAHFIEGIQLQDRATLMRLGEYKDAFTLIGRYPWFGVGVAGSPDADLYVGVSSVYLLMAEEMGVVGVAAFLVVVIGFMGSLWGAWRRVASPDPKGLRRPLGSPRLEALLLGLAAAVMGVMVGGFLDHYLFNLVYPHMSTLFWIYLGLGMSAVRVVGVGPTQ
ncbi:MAG: O-antigen ligase family protein [Chloroflexi bacterium]|nr:O-antigen ligase family protein [Chloroflexota bacterium]